MSMSDTVSQTIALLEQRKAQLETCIVGLRALDFGTGVPPATNGASVPRGSQQWKEKLRQAQLKNWHENGKRKRYRYSEYGLARRVAAIKARARARWQEKLKNAKTEEERMAVLTRMGYARTQAEYRERRKARG